MRQTPTTHDHYGSPSFAEQGPTRPRLREALTVVVERSKTRDETHHCGHAFLTLSANCGDSGVGPERRPCKPEGVDVRHRFELSADEWPGHGHPKKVPR